MNFLADANIFAPMVHGLRQMGHDVYDIKEQGLGTLPDSEIFSLAQDTKRILVTMDKDFTNILLYPPGEHEGIIVARLSRLKIESGTATFLNAIKSLGEDEIRGNIVIIDYQRTRVRKSRL